MGALPSPVMRRAPSNTMTLAVRVWLSSRHDQPAAATRQATANPYDAPHFTRRTGPSLEWFWFPSGAPNARPPRDALLLPGGEFLLELFEPILHEDHLRQRWRLRLFFELNHDEAPTIRCHIVVPEIGGGDESPLK